MTDIIIDTERLKKLISEELSDFDEPDLETGEIDTTRTYALCEAVSFLGQINGVQIHLTLTAEVDEFLPDSEPIVTGTTK